MAAAPSLQDRSQQIGLTQAERQSEGLCLSTAWKQESAAPPRDVLPAVHTTTRRAVGSRWRRHAVVACGPSQGHWPANHAAHWPLLQEHPLLCTEKAKKLQLLMAPRSLGAQQGF